MTRPIAAVIYFQQHGRSKHGQDGVGREAAVASAS
jgi:hypothetical protein